MRRLRLALRIIGVSMPFSDIHHKGKPLTIHKAVTQPHFDEKTVLVTDTWDYVDLWLKRKRSYKARFYWGQARSFYDATQALPKTASPLTAYYCFLNATKALLLAKGVPFSDAHGVTGYTTTGKSALANEYVKFKPGGILPALCTHLGEPATEVTYTLKDLLYNLAYIHRAFDLTYESAPELFVPVSNPRIVRSTRTHEAWFVAELREKYASMNTVNRLPSAFERELGADDKYLVRLRHRFNWRPKDKANSLRRYQNYHRRVRRHLHYICGPQRLWYIKRNNNVAGHILRSHMTLSFAAMHTNLKESKAMMC